VIGCGVSNRDLVGRGFELLAEGLEPFVERHLTAVVPGGMDWLEWLSRRGPNRGMTQSKSDPLVLLRAISQQDEISRTRFRVPSGAMRRNYGSAATTGLTTHCSTTPTRAGFLTRLNGFSGLRERLPRQAKFNDCFVTTCSHRPRARASQRRINLTVRTDRTAPRQGPTGCPVVRGFWVASCRYRGVRPQSLA
jgi:hypothetical protein